MQDQDRRLLLAYAGLVLTNLFWAGNAVVARGVAGEIPPFALAFWRWTGALLILLPLGLPHLHRGRAVIRRHWRALLGLGALSVAGFNTLLYLAAQTTTATNIGLVNSTIPLAVALAAWLLLRQRPTPRQLVGLAIAAAGVAVIVARGDWLVLRTLAIHPGDLWMIAAVVVWGLYSVLLRLWPVPLHPLGFLTATVTVGACLLLPLYLWELASVGGFGFGAGHLPVFGYLALFPSVLAFLFWNHGVAVAGPRTASLFIYLLPVFAAVLASLFLGEQLHVYHAAGGLLIVAGLYQASR